jgi:Uma2 family endonuclease
MTVDEFYTMDTEHDGIYELVAGEVRFRAPPFIREGEVSANLYCLLRTFINEHHIGRVVGRCGVIVCRNPDTVLMPNALFYSKERLPLDQVVLHAHDQPPDLVVEVLSPSNRPGQMRRKLQEYFAAGVRLAWIVDPEDKTVTIHTEPLASRTLTADQTLTGGEVLPGFSTQVSAIFD